MHDPDPARAGGKRRSRGASVTVSIAAETIGIFSVIEGRQPRDRGDVVREHLRLRGEQEHVVEREALLPELPLERQHVLDLLRGNSVLMGVRAP